MNNDTIGTTDVTEVAPQPRLGWTLGVLGMVLAGLILRLATLPRTPDVNDSVFFVRGVIRFSIAEMRPQWPGYPVYIWVAKLVHAVVPDPVHALHLVSAGASALAAWPLAGVTRAWASSVGASRPQADAAGWATAALWLVTPMAWVTGSQIVSDPLGLLCGATMLALCVHGEQSGRASWMAAAVLGGMTIGVRVVDATMLAPLAWKMWRARRELWWGWPAPVAIVAGLSAGTLPWAIWLILRDGPALVTRGEYHVLGHFQRWGHSALTDPRPLMRPFRAIRTLAVYGLGIGTYAMGWPRVIAGIGWVAVFAATAWSRWRSPVAKIVALWAVPQIAYLLAAHDVDFPRYLMPAAATACLAAGLAVRGGGRAGVVAVGVAVVSTFAVSLPLAAVQRRQPPVVYAAARFLARQPRAAVIAADVPTLALFLQEEAAGVPWVYAPANDVRRWQSRWGAEGRTVFATALPEPDSSGWRPVAHYCRDSLIDPRPPTELWLFAPGWTEEGASLLACGEEAAARN